MRVKRISEIEFAEMRDRWQSLLAESECDQLFMSWAWLYNWWIQYGQNSQNTLAVLLAHDEKEKLVGIAPLYIHKSKINGTPIAITTVLFLGSGKKSYSGFLTENLEFISQREKADCIAEAFYTYIGSHLVFDELYLSFVPTDSATRKQASQFSTNTNAYQRVQYASRSYCIPTNQSFTKFLGTLGKNTRLRAFNRRKKLEQYGAVTVETESDFSVLLRLLSRFHESRWNKKSDFLNHLKFITALVSYGGIKTSGVILKLDGHAIGCTIDLVCADKAYNLQLGFEDFSSRKISTGILTLGYAIEHFCDNPEIYDYDLLIGKGKNTDYKGSLTENTRRVESVQIIVPGRAKIVYKLKDLLIKSKPLS